jgi:hypothetical protein
MRALNRIEKTAANVWRVLRETNVWNSTINLTKNTKGNENRSIANTLIISPESAAGF